MAAQRLCLFAYFGEVETLVGGNHRVVVVPLLQVVVGEVAVGLAQLRLLRHLKRVSGMSATTYPVALTVLNVLRVGGSCLGGLASPVETAGQRVEGASLHVADAVGSPKALLRRLVHAHLLVDLTHRHNHPRVRRAEVLRTSIKPGQGKVNKKRYFVSLPQL